VPGEIPEARRLERAFDREGTRVAAGSEKGEIAVLAVDAAGG
jgi:hypothetical protein